MRFSAVWPPLAAITSADHQWKECTSDGPRANIRTPDVVEFAVSPQVGQAVLACPPAKLSTSKGMAQPIFPTGLKLRGDIRSSEHTSSEVVDLGRAGGDHGGIGCSAELRVCSTYAPGTY